MFTDVRVTPINILLAQKLFACVNRPRAKGRDFFDIVFLLALGVTPDYAYLQQKIQVSNADELRTYILDKTSTYNFKELAEDVQPFLFTPADAVRVERFQDVFTHAKL